jgi:hypothetical protein
MKQWIGMASVAALAAAGVLMVARNSQAAPKAEQSAQVFPCYMINNPVTCSLKSGGQCTWVNEQCVPVQ